MIYLPFSKHELCQVHTSRLITLHHRMASLECVTAFFNSNWSQQWQLGAFRCSGFVILIRENVFRSSKHADRFILFFSEIFQRRMCHTIQFNLIGLPFSFGSMQPSRVCHPALTSACLSLHFCSSVVEKSFSLKFYVYKPSSLARNRPSGDTRLSSGRKRIENNEWKWQTKASPALLTVSALAMFVRFRVLANLNQATKSCDDRITVAASDAMDEIAFIWRTDVVHFRSTTLPVPTASTHAHNATPTGLWQVQLMPKVRNCPRKKMK